MKLGLSIIAVIIAGVAPVRAEPLPPFPPRPPFTATLSNTTPLVFGMRPDEAAAALGSPLNFVSGRPGNEVYLAFRHYGGFFIRNDRLFLLFRHGRLTGWKGDWGSNWMWR